MYVTSILARTLHPSPHLSVYQMINKFVFRGGSQGKWADSEEVKPKGESSVKPYVSPYCTENQYAESRVKA